MSKLQYITVLGCGVLGSQIAWHTAFKGKHVVVYNASEASLDKCRRVHEQYAAIYQADFGASADALQQTHARLRYISDLATAVSEADLVIESVPEVPEIKTRVYQQMAPLLPAHTLVATNSSTLLPSDFAEASGRPAKFCALHYASPVWTKNMVEIMAHAGTHQSTLDEVTEFTIETGMVPIPVLKEQNGYVANTWFVALQNAAQTLVTNGIATPEVVDRTFMINNRGCSMGPMGLMDIVGMQTVYDVCSHWGALNNDAQMLANAEYIKIHFLDKGKLGVLSGEGYYRYPNPAFAAPDFLAVPDLAQAREIAALAGAICK